MGGSGSGRLKNPPKVKEMLKSILPLSDIFENDELEMYHNLVDVYLKDFDSSTLTSGDMDDIMDLAKNRVLEFRLLKNSKGNPNKQIDLTNTMEKIHKNNKILKENLSSRRKDRINSSDMKGFSIVDLAVAFDKDRKLELMEKARKLKKEEKKILKEREGWVGNKNDVEGVI